MSILKTYKTYNNGAVIENCWTRGHKFHRDDGPAYERFHIYNGEAKLIEEKWFQHGIMHRTNGPSFTRWIICMNGQTLKTFEAWYQNDQLHRTYGPARTNWVTINTRTEVGQMEWYQYDKFHRVDGPADIYFRDSPTGKNFVSYEAWYRDGKFHRADGPAHVERTAEWGTGEILILREAWFQDNKLHRDGFLPAVEDRHYKGGRPYTLPTLNKSGRAIVRFMMRVLTMRQQKKAAVIDVIQSHSCAFPHLDRIIFEYI